jgi:hypothetical protein
MGLENVEDCVTLEIPVTFVVTYDRTSELRKELATYPTEAQVTALRQEMESMFMHVLEGLNIGVEDLVFGMRYGGEQ